eukprot:scaffold14037_cov32-Cyclotella_meneghiniana.AAC.1
MKLVFSTALFVAAIVARASASKDQEIVYSKLSSVSEDAGPGLASSLSRQAFLPRTTATTIVRNAGTSAKTTEKMMTTMSFATPISFRKGDEDACTAMLTR